MVLSTEFRTYVSMVSLVLLLYNTDIPSGGKRCCCLLLHCVVDGFMEPMS